jgi:hypothetical protein
MAMENPLSGWWYTYPSEKYEFVSWDYYSQLDGTRIQMFQTTNQLCIDDVLIKTYKNL